LHPQRYDATKLPLAQRESFRLAANGDVAEHVQTAINSRSASDSSRHSSVRSTRLRDALPTILFVAPPAIADIQVAMSMRRWWVSLLPFKHRWSPMSGLNISGRVLPTHFDLWRELELNGDRQGERVKQLLLIAASLLHHDNALPPIDGFQDN
jgi:hypothetical protein